MSRVFGCVAAMLEAATSLLSRCPQWACEGRCLQLTRQFSCNTLGAASLAATNSYGHLLVTVEASNQITSSSMAQHACSRPSVSSGPCFSS